MKLFIFATIFGISVSIGITWHFLILATAAGIATELTRPRYFY
jgi:hypothetical protein